ncbi:MAG TPA: hypothetical protein VGG27_15575 [Magnetospirillaceae bacterium]|jgi:hypothetical protein
MRAMKAKRTPHRMILAVVLATAVLVGCNRAEETKGTLFPSSSSHVSPPPVAVPRLPPGSFDAAQSRAERGEAARLRQANDAAAARGHAEHAAMLWPADLAAWDELKADCTALNDVTCERYADFFHAKIEFVTPLPPRMAVLGFASLNASGLGVKVGDYTYDQQTLDTALRLASFYDEQDQLRDARLKPKPAATPSAAK